MKRIVLTTLILSMIFISIGWLFYTQEIKYWLPTPVPDDYTPVPIGSMVTLNELPEGKKKFLHFYNPNCPCSKFNFTTYKNLIEAYQDDFDCYAIIQESLEGIPVSDLDYLNKLKVTLVADKNKEFANTLGVYSTPQIVLLDEENKIYYRGNYNQARYCTNNTTFFARIAIDSMINGKNYVFPETAFTAYGCVLERDTH